MNWRRLYLLLGLWCCLLMAPAVLTQLGLFGQIDMHTSIPGSLAGLWIGGYLAQFAIFMWIMRLVAADKLLQQIVWWLAASLMPWAADWTQPVSPWFVLLCFAIVLAIALWIVGVTRAAAAFQQYGVRATGVVLEVLKPWMNVVVNNVYIRRKLRLRIERDDGVPAYEDFLSGLFMLGEIPSPGDSLRLLVDPGNPRRIEYDKSATSAPAAPVRSAAPPSSAHGNIADQLAKLAELHARGALTAAEFDAAKRKLLH